MRHVALMFASAARENIIMGFEDLNRIDRFQNDNGYGSDEDFNDAVFTVKSSPETALAMTGIATVAGDQPDTDGDGIYDSDELATDTDGDGILNISDPDDDGDGIPTPTEGTIDTDADGTQNYLDTDSDNDGISDQTEGGRDTDLDGIANYLDTDSDDDSIPDSVEGNIDTDGDGTPDRIDPDDDGDGIPTNQEGNTDFDIDGIANYLDTDSDNDTITDDLELSGDSDLDGALDLYDTDDDNDGIPSELEGSADADNDGIGNHADLDSDNDTLSDNFEGNIDSDNDGIADRVDSDDDGDGIETALEGVDDPDGDGLANYLDTDSDGDGIEDGSDFVALSVTSIVLQEGYNGTPLVSGDRLTYTVTVTNTGIQTATEVQVSDLIPAHTTYVTGSLSINGVEDPTVLGGDTSLLLSDLMSEYRHELTYSVEIDASLNPEARTVSLQIVSICNESTAPAISDNDSNGHCGIEDDGIDHPLDSDIYTNDDDPTVMPLLQGTISERCYLAFEDLQNAGWNDWDMNDLVLDVSSYYVINSNEDVESVVVTYQLLARGAGMDSRLYLTLPFAGYGAWQTLYLNTNGSLEQNEVGSSTDGATLQLWSSSRDALPAYTGLKYDWGAARTERFDPSAPGKMAVVNIYFDSAEANPLETFSVSPHDTWAYIPGTDQQIHRMEYSLASTQIVYQGPLFGRSLPFVIKLNTDFAWPAEGQAIWNSHPDYVPYIKSGGTTHLDWADTIDIWRVWFDHEGRMPNRDELNPAATSDIYKDYVDLYSKP